VGALAYFLAAAPPSHSGWQDDTALKGHLIKSGMIASRSVMSKGTQTSFERIDLQSLLSQ